MTRRKTIVKKRMKRGPGQYERDLDRVGANYVPLTPLSFLARSASVYPRKPAVIHGDLRFSYADFARRGLVPARYGFDSGPGPISSRVGLRGRLSSGRCGATS